MSVNKYLEKIAESYEIPHHAKAGKVPRSKPLHLYQMEAFERSARPTNLRSIIQHKNAVRWNFDYEQ